MVRKLFKTRKQGEELLLEACRFDHHNKVRNLLIAGVDPNLPVTTKLRVDSQLTANNSLSTNKKQQDGGKGHEDSGHMPLTIAAKKGNIRTIIVLLEFSQTRFDQTDYQGRTALHWICKMGHIDAFRAILEKFKQYPPYRIVTPVAGGKKRKVFPDIHDILCETDKLGRNCLMLASWSGHLHIVKLFLEVIAGKSKPMLDILNAKEQEKNWSALFGASKYGHANVVKQLIDVGADVNSTDYLQNTPLIVATRNNHSQIVSLLLTGGADAQMCDHNKRTAFHEASERCLYDILEMLVVNVKTKKGVRSLLGTMASLEKTCGLSVSELARSANDYPRKRETLHFLFDTNFMIFSDYKTFG